MIANSPESFVVSFFGGGLCAAVDFQMLITMTPLIEKMNFVQIYIVGGFNGQEVLSSAEVFDADTKQWSFIRSMLSPRSGVSLIAYRDCLYALGGFNGYSRLNTGLSILLSFLLLLSVSFCETSLK